MNAFEHLKKNWLKYGFETFVVVVGVCNEQIPNFWNRFSRIAILGCMIVLGACSPPDQKNARPNILFCMADDWGWPHAGAYGDAVQTPNFDRIANEGILFHNMYVSSPSCTPSRNAVFTGKYHWELGPGANLWSTLPSEHESFIHLLADNGYAIGRNRAKSWGPGNLDDWIKTHGAHPSGEAFDTFKNFLDAKPNDDQPFFFWLATSDPHRDYTAGSGAESGIDISSVHLFEHFPESDIVRSDVADYYYEVQRWDTLVGKAISELEQRGILENTIIIMTGDHGMPFPRGKGNLYDSGVRVPFAMRWGVQVQKPAETQAFTSFTDIAPTLLEMTGFAVPSDMTGKSFQSIVLSGAEDVDRSEVVFGRERHTPSQEVPETAGYPSRGLRNNDFLYIRNYRPDLWPAGTGETDNTHFPGQWYSDCDGGPTKNYIILNKDTDEDCARAYELAFAKRPAEELYDLANDPGQVRNVAGNPKYAEMVTTLRTRLEKRLSELNDPRATHPDYTGFDDHPYLGGGGGMRPTAEELRN